MTTFGSQDKGQLISEWIFGQISQKANQVFDGFEDTKISFWD